MLNEDSINVKIDFSIYPLPSSFYFFLKRPPLPPPHSNAFIFQVAGGGESNLIYTSSGNQKTMHAHFNQMMSLRRLLKPGLPWKHKILRVGVGHPSSLPRSNEGTARPRPERSHQEDNPQIWRWAPQHLALSWSSHHLPQLIIFMGPGTAPGISATLLLELCWRFMDGVGSLPATAGIPLYLGCHVLLSKLRDAVNGPRRAQPWCRRSQWWAQHPLQGRRHKLGERSLPLGAPKREV